MSRIFISYKRVDKDKVFKIKDRIESALGEKCWIDIDGIESDAQFKNVIIKAINDCEIFLFMYSKAHSWIVDFEKDWTVCELNFAAKKGKRIVFINLDGSPLTDEFEFDYGSKQQVDAASEDALKHLISDLEEWLAIRKTNNTTPILTIPQSGECTQFLVGDSGELTTKVFVHGIEVSEEDIQHHLDKAGIYIPQTNQSTIHQTTKGGDIESNVAVEDGSEHDYNALCKIKSLINAIRNNNLYLGLILVFAICVALPLGYNCINSETIMNEDSNSTLSERYRSIVHTEFPKWAEQHNADNRYLLLVDYSIPSNQDRFFIWDTQVDSIVEQFWCTHGFGGHSTPEIPEFSNTSGSNCSSLGWFLVERGTGVSKTHGYTYHAVDGLSPTNSNARSRGILIHTWWSVDKAFQSKINHPMDKCESQCAGNFITTSEGYDVIDRYIRSRDKKLLLYAFNGVK